MKYKFELNPIISIFHDFVTNQVINEVSVHRTCSLFDLLRQKYVVVTNKLKSCLLSYSKYILDYYEDSDFLPTSLNPINAIFRCFIFGILYLFSFNNVRNNYFSSELKN